jgi:hypothetical protein
MSAFEPIIVQSDDPSVRVWEFGKENHIRCLASASDTAGGFPSLRTVYLQVRSFPSTSTVMRMSIGTFSMMDSSSVLAPR